MAFATASFGLSLFSTGMSLFTELPSGKVIVSVPWATCMLAMGSMPMKLLAFSLP